MEVLFLIMIIGFFVYAFTCDPKVEDFEEEEEDNVQVVARTDYPYNFDQYIGHNNILYELNMILTNYERLNEKIDHILFEGNGGLGKTNLAEIIANTVGKGYFPVIGESLKNTKIVDDLLMRIPEGGILFIDEIHNMKLEVMEYLYHPMEKGKIFRKDGSVHELPNITIIGATTNAENLPDPMLQRFTYKFHLERYSNTDIVKIIKHCLPSNVKSITDEALELIAIMSQGTIRKAREEWLKACTTYALYHEKSEIDEEIVKEVIKLREADSITGLNKLQINVLKALFGSDNPLGIRNLATRLELDPKKLELKLEPHLIVSGFMEKTTKGRVITKRGLETMLRISEGAPE